MSTLFLNKQTAGKYYPLGEFDSLSKIGRGDMLNVESRCLSVSLLPGTPIQLGPLAKDQINSVPQIPETPLYHFQQLIVFNQYQLYKFNFLNVGSKHIKKLWPWTMSQLLTFFNLTDILYLPSQRVTNGNLPYGWFSIFSAVSDSGSVRRGLCSLPRVREQAAWDQCIFLNVYSGRKIFNVYFAKLFSMSISDQCIFLGTFSFAPPVCIVQLIWETVMTLKDATSKLNSRDAKLAP